MSGTSTLRLGWPQQALPALATRPTVKERAGIDSEANPPVRQRQRLAIEFHQTVSPGVAQLVGSRCPDAVFARVACCVVQPLDGMSRRRARPHVGHVVLKSSPAAPLVAYGDAARTVVLEGFVLRIGAPKNHAPPTVPVRSARRPMSAVHLRSHFPGDLAMEAATRRRRAVPHAVGVNHLFRATHAAKLPAGLPAWGVLRAGNGGEAAKYLACEVECSCHTQHRITSLGAGCQIVIGSSR